MPVLSMWNWYVKYKSVLSYLYSTYILEFLEYHFNDGFIEIYVS